MAQKNSQTYLRHIQVLFRHGDRTPILPIQSNIEWPSPPGHLTNRGRTRAYNLGRFLAEHYKPFLERITRYDIVARSSIYERCTESTQLLLAGLFPPKSEEIWSSDVQLASLWRPIFIETQTEQADDILISKTHPKLEEMFQKNLKHSKAKKLFEENLDFIKELLTAFNSPTDFISFFKLCDNIKCGRSYLGKDFRFPGGLDDTTFEKINNLFTRAQKIFYRGNEPDEIELFNRLRVKPFLQYMLNNIEQVQKTGIRAKIHVLGSHDIKILDLLFCGMDIEIDFPEFSTAAVFEVWSNGNDNDDYIKIKYIEPTKDFKITELDFQKSERLAKYSDGTKISVLKLREAFNDVLVL